MNTKLIFIRNKLLNEENDIPYKKNLLEILSSLSKDSKFLPICKLVINNALDDININKLKSAGYQINLIHNLPIEKEYSQKWDNEHFFEFEVPLYFENEDDPERIKKMILLLAEIIKELKLI